MAILHQSSFGYFICHRRFSEEINGKPYKSVLFDIRTPFYKDLEAAAEAKALESGIPRVRKRKKKQIEKQLPLEESSVRSFLSELSPFFQPQPTSSDLLHNNKSSREAVANFMSSPFAVTCQDTSQTTHILNSEDGNKEEQCLGDHTFLFPALSEFYKQDVSELDILVKRGRTFPLIIMDPPWMNRFIKRKRTTGVKTGYHTMDNDFLAEMPIAKLCTKGSLVVVWCTNSPTHLDYLLTTLLPAWDLEYVTTWFWIKVTTAGNFVCPWNGPSGKHPFERIIIARRIENKSPVLLPSIPNNQLVVSVPCAIHSFKPPLQRLLQPYIHASDSGDYHLELFARSLLPNTVSWGDQLPLLQHVDLFEN